MLILYLKLMFLHVKVFYIVMPFKQYCVSEYLTLRAYLQIIFRVLK